MKVFEPKYVQRIKNKYGQLPDYEKPEIYSIVVSDKCQYLRDEIEAMVAVFSEDERAKVIPRLQAKDNFIQTYDELIVGNLLRKLSYKVEYDKKIEDITPDWYVHAKGEIPNFIVEVFTTGFLGNHSQEYRAANNLEERLRQIPIGVTLKIEIDDHGNLSQGRNKQITEEIKRWLTQEAPLIGNQYSGDGFDCEISNYNSNSLTAKPYIVPKFDLVDTKRLIKNIKEKNQKYKDLKMPLVVSVVTDDIILTEELRNILLGGRGFKEIYNKNTGVKESTISFLLNDGLFNKKPDLSAVVWVSQVWSGGRMTAIYNPTATKPLPANTFNEDYCPLYELNR
jgi:hypothetical protein